MRNIHPFEVPSSHVEFLLDAHRFPEATSMAFYGETLETKGPPPSQGVTVDEQFAEHQEHHFKKEAWGHVKAWSKATGVTMNILGYRGRIAASHAEEYGMLMADEKLERFIFVDFIRRNAPGAENLDAAGHERLFVDRANRLFGLLQYMGAPTPVYMAATWLAPYLKLEFQRLPPEFLSAIPADPASEPPAPTSRTLFFTPTTYTGALGSDDIWRIDLNLRQRMGASGDSPTRWVKIFGGPFGGLERRKLVITSGCEECGKVDGLKRCAACQGPQYCSAECQKKRWGGKTGHKTVCQANKKKP